MIGASLIRTAIAVFVVAAPLLCLAGTLKDLGTVGTVYAYRRAEFPG